ncbi:MAG: hypothetical protein OEW08_06230 [Gammaproteobacteria bacterium]|nr:hypothetical protein [Gammaproteobacteria bacterium]
MMQPTLVTVNDGIFQSPYRGQAQLTTDFAENPSGRFEYAIDNFTFRNPLKPVTVGPEAGIEFRRSFDPKTDFVIGVSSWEMSSKSRIIVTFPLQGNASNQATYDRRGKLRITQYYMGVRRYIGEKTRTYNVYLDANLRELFDINYQDENVFSFISGPPKGYKRIDIIKARSTGVSMVQLGVGMEAKVMDRISLGLEGAYAVGFNHPFLRNLDERQDFNGGDLLNFRVPPIVNGTENDVYYVSPDGQRLEEARLDLNGWRVALKINVEF